MLTSKEIKKQYEQVKESDFFNFILQVVISYMDYAEAKEYLVKDITEEEFNAKEWKVKNPTDEIAIEEMRGYMEFAWEKCAGERGLSAGRSVTKIGAWLMLLGDPLADKLLGEDDGSYCPYGAPLLAEVCQKYGFEMPDEIFFTELGHWVNPYK